MPGSPRSTSARLSPARALASSRSSTSHSLRRPRSPGRRPRRPDPGSLPELGIPTDTTLTSALGQRAGDARRRLAAVGESPARMVSMMLLKNRKEVVDFGCELVRVLEEEAMAGVRVDDQLGIREMAREKIGVHGRNHDVVAAVGDKGRLSDSGQPRELAQVGDAPVIDRFRLGVAHGQGRSLIAVQCASEDPSEKLLAPGLARLGRRGAEIGSVLGALDILVGVPGDFSTPVMESTAALRAGAAEDKPPYQAGAQQDDFLRDESAGGEAE